MRLQPSLSPFLVSLVAFTGCTAQKVPTAPPAMNPVPAAAARGADPAGAPTLPDAAYSAISSTAMGVTGDIRTAPGKIVFAGHPFALTLQRVYTGQSLQDANTLFSKQPTASDRAALYSVNIPGSLKLANGNTYCGKETTTYLLLLESGKELSVAGFSGSSAPDITPAVINNSTALCGTYSYQKK